MTESSESECKIGSVSFWLEIFKLSSIAVCPATPHRSRSSTRHSRSTLADEINDEDDGYDRHNSSNSKLFGADGCGGGVDESEVVCTIITAEQP